MRELIATITADADIAFDEFELDGGGRLIVPLIEARGRHGDELRPG